ADALDRGRQRVLGRLAKKRQNVISLALQVALRSSQCFRLPGRVSPPETVPDFGELVSPISHDCQIAEDKDSFLGLPEPVIRAFGGIIIPTATTARERRFKRPQPGGTFKSIVSIVRIERD